VSEDVRAWIGLIVVVVVVMAFVSVMVAIQARERGRARVRRALVLIWAAVLVSLGVGWLLSHGIGGPVFDVSLSGSPRLLTRPLGGGQLALAIAGVAVMLALYIGAILTLRDLMRGVPPVAVPERDDGVEGDDR